MWTLLVSRGLFPKFELGELVSAAVCWSIGELEGFLFCSRWRFTSVAFICVYVPESLHCRLYFYEVTREPPTAAESLILRSHHRYHWSAKIIRHGNISLSYNSCDSSCGNAFADFVEVFDIGPSRFKFHLRTSFYNVHFTCREGQVKRHECLRVSVVITHKFHLRYACCFDGDFLVFDILQSSVAP